MVGGEVMGPRLELDRDALVFVLLGASAVGKSTIAAHLLGTGVVDATATWTTRQPRAGERSTSHDHRFVSGEEFDARRQSSGFLAEQEIYGFRYGVTYLRRPFPGREPLIVLKPTFMSAFTAHYKRTRIYQIEASADVLPDRMRARGQTEADITARMKEHERETTEARGFAHVIFNNDGLLADTLRQVEAQLMADREAYMAEVVLGETSAVLD